MNALPAILSQVSRVNLTQLEKWRPFVEPSFHLAKLGFLAYIVASVLSSVSVFVFLGEGSLQQTGSSQLMSDGESFTASANFRDLQKKIKDRNIFHLEGTFPDEPDPLSAGAMKAMVFDENAPCSKTSLNIELLGTIYMGANGPSLATIQEKGYSQADIYRKGEVIYGNDQAKIHRIEQKRVIINHSGKKECIELDAEATALYGSSSSAVVPTDAVAGEVEGCSSASLEEKYVQEQTANGFVNIMNGGRLIPHNKDGQHIGFKLIGVAEGSLFEKACLKNGDVITQVNDIPLQADQAFAFYEAFNAERKIRVNLLRNGTNPMTINVDVR